MKRKIFVIIFLGLTFILSEANPQSAKDVQKVSVIAPPEAPPSCLDTYLSGVANIWNIYCASMTDCAIIFQYDLNGEIECKLYASDLYLNMHGVLEAMYDRCKVNEPQP
ncbi:hypothetical protein D9M68_594650 [compost metagenome]